MIHQRQGLPFGFKACNHAFRIHPRFDHLKGHAPQDWRLLLRHENDAPATFPDLLQQLVTIDPVA